MRDPLIIESLRRKYQALGPTMDESLRRHWAAAEALELPRGGLSAVAEATGLSMTTIRRGVRELHAPPGGPVGSPSRRRIRHPGGGRKTLAAHDPTLLSDLERLVDPVTRGDPQSPLRWTCKSTRNLADALNRQGHRVSPGTVASMLKDCKYSLQANRKTREGSSHADRNQQFEHINDRVYQFLTRGEPVVSMDTKEKELLGDFKNAGREFQPEGYPEETGCHDFEDKTLGKAVPYGLYDMTSDRGWVRVGIDHDTAEFAVAALRGWWQEMGQPVYPKAKELLLTVDAGGSNGNRNRLWKLSLQRLADEIGLRISVCHFPPGTSKWNKIEHQMSNRITQNWRGRPLRSLEVIVNLIGATKTRSGSRIQVAVDKNAYRLGIKVSDEEFARIRIEPEEFHGEWNYTILPRQSGI
jgi:Rhodopirellula transposase DDE domain